MTMPESYGGTMEKHVQQLVELAGHAGDELGELRGTLLRSLNWRNDHEMPNGTESDIYRFPEGFVPEDIAALFKPGLKTVNETVSYTHLDVYKRQRGHRHQADR